MQLLLLLIEYDLKYDRNTLLLQILIKDLLIFEYVYTIIVLNNVSSSFIVNVFIKSTCLLDTVAVNTAYYHINILLNLINLISPKRTNQKTRNTEQEKIKLKKDLQLKNGLDALKIS